VVRRGHGRAGRCTDLQIDPRCLDGDSRSRPESVKGTKSRMWLWHFSGQTDIFESNGRHINVNLPTATSPIWFFSELCGETKKETGGSIFRDIPVQQLGDSLCSSLQGSFRPSSCFFSRATFGGHIPPLCAPTLTRVVREKRAVRERTPDPSCPG
jgi:hypothetical protein